MKSHVVVYEHKTVYSLICVCIHKFDLWISCLLMTSNKHGEAFGLLHRLTFHGHLAGFDSNSDLPNRPCVWSLRAIGGDAMFSPCLGCIQIAMIAAPEGLSPLSPAVHPVLSSCQQFVYGTLFAKLIFPPFKWEPASEREGERESKWGR